MRSPDQLARFIRDQLPPAGLFAGLQWRITPKPFALDANLAQQLQALGRVLLQFYRAANLLYRHSAAGKQPAWVADWLDRGKPAALIQLQRAPEFKLDLPKVIRPDLLLTEEGLSLTELDSVPGGIGLTAWLNRTYAAAAELQQAPAASTPRQPALLGGTTGMLDGFAQIFGQAPRVHVVVSEEAATYKPEMRWLCAQLGTDRFEVRDTTFTGFAEGEAVYRFFELFDLDQVPNAWTIFELARQKKLLLTPPPKPALEEKLWLALLWNRNLRGFWRQELGEAFFQRLLELVPYSWIVDPTPLPPNAAIPELNLTDWHQLKTLSQRQRQLVLKVSGFSPLAWGARGVFLGSDLSQADWSAAVDQAIRSAPTSPYILQRYAKPRVIEAEYYDFDREELVTMPARVRLCPYYFVVGNGDAARAQLGGVLATLCPADKKIIHGMAQAILAPCSVQAPDRPPKA